VTLPLAALAPGLRPRLVLGAFPSPLESHDGVAERLGLEVLLVKREDLNGALFGGNKLRAIEWVLPAAGPAIVTMGGFGSTWCAALAMAAATTGRCVYPGLFPQPWSATVAGTLSVTAEHGRPALAATRSGLPRALFSAWREARRAGPVTWLPAGGATPLAVLGNVNAALEFASQCAELGASPPEAVVVPLGSCGTAAGLLIGMWLVGWPVEVCAVRVSDPWFANRHRVYSLVRRACRLLARAGLEVRPGRATLRVDGGQLGAGYGQSTPAAEVARLEAAKAGITLDLTYGAKAWAALSTLADSFRRVCYWNTFDPRLAPGITRVAPLVQEARCYAEMMWPPPKST
jgi:D-cysteine desulfhydrase